MSKKLTVTIIGASGFLGQHTVRRLLETTNYTVRAVCRHPEKILINPAYEERLERVPADIFDGSAMQSSLIGADVAVYLVHMMGVKGDYYKKEAKAARTFGKAAQAASLQRVVYMSGLGNDRDRLSKHLASRHHTGKILKQFVPITIELRASMIIGGGSAAYDIMRAFVHDLPVQPLPRFAVTQTQPITIDDAVTYIIKSLTVPVSNSEIVDIGGPQVLTYKDLIAHYAEYCGKKPFFIIVPFVPVWLGAQFLNMFAPRHHAKIGRQMAESLKYPMVTVNNRAAELFPDIKPEPIETAFS